MVQDTRAVHAARRARVLALLEDAVLVLPAAPEVRVGRDQELRYRPDPDLYYLTGYPEPEAVAVFSPANRHAPFTLFVRPRDPERELWTGTRGGPEAAMERFGADEALPLDELDRRLPRMLGGASTIYFPLGSGRDHVEALVRGVLTNARQARQRRGEGARALSDPGVLLDELRLVKDAHELQLLREAARISAEAFRDAARAIRPGAGEWEVEAALEHGFRSRGAAGPAFASIVAAGANATVLHYIQNAARLRDGELLLIDAGASHRMYAGDISRTFPVSGRFSPAQRDLYDAVRAAHRRAIEAVRPGATVAGIHQAAVRALVDALVALGLLQGEADELIEREQHRPFYPHQTSHWLGLDVHDVGDYAVRGSPRPLHPGMVLTIEPGLYIPAGLDTAPPALRGLGVRIEDDVAVTDDGHEVLTRDLPADAEDVEALVRGHA